MDSSKNPVAAILALLTSAVEAGRWMAKDAGLDLGMDEEDLKEELEKYKGGLELLLHALLAGPGLITTTVEMAVVSHPSWAGDDTFTLRVERREEVLDIELDVWKGRVMIGLVCHVADEKMVFQTMSAHTESSRYFLLSLFDRLEAAGALSDLSQAVAQVHAA